MSEAIFDFVGYSIKHFEYTKTEEKNEHDKTEIPVSFEATQAFTKDYKSGKLLLSVQVNVPDTSISLSIELEGFFNINNEMLYEEDSKIIKDKAEINRMFLYNGTSILYPYLRSVVTMFTSLDNVEAIILPVLDVRKLDAIED